MRRVASKIYYAYMHVPRGTSSILRIGTLAKLQQRRTYDLRPFDGQGRIEFSNEYLYNVLHCIVA
jgi:hypothetical protein